MTRLPVLGLAALVGACVVWMSWPLPLHVGEVWTSARAEGDLAWSLLLHAWTTDALLGHGSWTQDPRTWAPEGGSLPTSAWNLVALGSTAWLGWGSSALAGWHRSMLWVGLLNGAGGAWLGHRVGGRAGAVVGAVACACAPLPWFELAEGRLEQGLIGPLAVWLGEAWALPRAPRPALAGVSLGLVAATYWFFGPIGAVVALPLLLAGPGRQAPTGPLGPWLVGGALLLAIVGLGLAPIAEAAWSGSRGAAVSDPVLSRVQRISSSVSPLALLLGGPLPAHRLPVAVVLALPLAAIRPTVRPWALAVALAGVLAAGALVTIDGQPLRIAGMELSLPLRALDLLPGFSRFWWPDRIVAVAMVAGAGLLAAATSSVPARFAWPLVGMVGLALAVDGRLQLRTAVERGDPRIPSSPHDPTPADGFFAPPAAPRPPGDGPVVVGPWSRTANLLPLVALASGRPLLRGDGAADRRLWPAAFADRVAASPLLTALALDRPPPTGAAAELDRLGVQTVIWQASADADTAAWSDALGCPPVAHGLWWVWDRTREACR